MTIIAGAMLGVALIGRTIANDARPTDIRSGSLRDNPGVLVGAPDAYAWTARGWHDSIEWAKAVAVEDARSRPTDQEQVPTSRPVGDMDDAGGLRSLICQPAYDWDCGRAVAIFGCESVHFRTDVVYGPTVSATNDRGVGQLNAVHSQKFSDKGWDYYTDAFDPVKNLEIAYEIYKDSGWGPWSCSRLV